MPTSLIPCSTTRQTGSDWCLNFTCIEEQFTEWNVFIHHYVMDVFPERILICMWNVCVLHLQTFTYTFTYKSRKSDMRQTDRQTEASQHRVNGARHFSTGQLPPLTLWFPSPAASCRLMFLNWNLNTTRSFLSFLTPQVSVMSCNTSWRAQ